VLTSATDELRRYIRGAMPSASRGRLRNVRPLAARKPFPLLDVVPESLRGVMLDFLWSHEWLWALELPVRRVPVDELRWHLALPMWSSDGVAFTVSPEQVRTEPGRYPAQYTRTMAADVAFPLDALVRAEGHLTLLDGVHRLLKADLLGHVTVDVRELPTARLDEIAA
jgi:hypothetical protein